MKDLEKTWEGVSSEENGFEAYGGTEGKKRFYYVAKRLQDVVLSALALVLLSPLLLVIAAAVVIDDPKGGPVFSQFRCGRGGKTFRLYKFRTMCVGAEKGLEKEMRRNVGAMLLHRVGTVVIFNTDNLLISKFVGVAAAGLYSIAPQ